MDTNKLAIKLPLIFSSICIGAMSYIAFIDPQSRAELSDRDYLRQWAGMFKNSLFPMATLISTPILSGFYVYKLTNIQIPFHHHSFHYTY